jgi:hypothetical protein
MCTFGRGKSVNTEGPLCVSAHCGVMTMLSGLVYKTIDTIRNGKVVVVMGREV